MIEVGSSRVVMADYWLAERFGRWWLTVRRALRLRPVGTDLPGLCGRVARGEALPAGELQRAQAFASAMWWRSAIVVFIPFLVIGVAAKEASARNAVSFGTVLLLLPLGFYPSLAVLQSVMAFCRSGFNQGYVRRAGPGALEQPLPRGELGLPSRWDFWAVLAAGATLCAILGYAGLHNAPH